MQLYLLVALGGALGTALRLYLDQVVTAHYGSAFPWATLVINISGSFLIGLIYTVTDPAGGRWFASADMRLFLMTGICGGYTTFSAFSLRTVLLAREGEWFYAGANAVGSVLLCVVGAWLGYLLGAALNSPR